MEGDTAEGGTFADELASLKRRGATALVSAGSAVDGPVCTSLLGDDAAGRRRLLLEPIGAGRHVRDVDGEHTVRLDVPTASRRVSSTVTAAGAAGGPTAGPAGPSPADLAGLTTRVREAIESLGGDDLEPGQLRVCGGDLDPLVASFGTLAVRRYLQLTAATVMDVGGLAHFHLPADSGVEPTLRSLFDIVVDVRRRPGGEREQRWRLRDSGLETGWLPLVVD